MSRIPLLVFAGSFWSGSSESGLSSGFRELGWAVQEVDQRDVGGYAGNVTGLKVLSRLMRSAIHDEYCRKIVEVCRALRPDFFFVVKGVGITAELLRQIKATGARAVMYYPDVQFEHNDLFTESFLEYDLFVTTKTFHLDYLENILAAGRVAYVPHGYSASVHRPILTKMRETDYVTDVVHVGNHSEYKQLWMEGAIAALPDVAFRLIGDRWQNHFGSGPSENCDVSGVRLGIAYAEAIQTARINIAFHSGPTTSGWQDWVSTRTFEIPACGGFMLHIDNEEIREIFTPGVEIDVFSTPEELADKIRFYLARPTVRAEMIDKAYRRCVPQYSYSQRARQIAALLSL